MIAGLLSSCASVNGVFTKRKYTKGHYFDLAHKKQTPKIETRTEIENERTDEVAVLALASGETPGAVQTGSFVTEPADHISGNKLFSDSPFAPNILTLKAESKSPFVNFHRKLELQLQRPSDAASAGKLVLYIILFFVLTLIYTLAIIVKSPGFPLGLAIVVAMLGSLLTLLTGQLFI
jgi:hypothetical protein